MPNGPAYKKLINLLFAAAFLLILCAGLIRTVWFPKEINYYENRYANQIPALSLDSLENQKFQDGLEAAFSDQILLSSTLKKAYNTVTGSFARKIMGSVLMANQDRYFAFMGATIFGGNQLVFLPRALAEMTDALSSKAQHYNALAAAHPELEFYSYFIEKDTDINFATNDKVGAAEFFYKQLTLPETHEAAFSVNSYDEFRDNFYLTDHHWNHKGSYRGYQEVLSLLGVQDAPLVPREEVLVHPAFIGSKSAYAGTDFFSEPFAAYRFEFPAMTVTANGAAAPDYGAQTALLNSQPEKIGYGTFYGADLGEVILDTHRPERDNILILGESYDNAILKLLASHFNQTYSVDLRYYEHYMKQPFRFSEYVKQHHIDRVLFIGNVDYFIMDAFRVEG